MKCIIVEDEPLAQEVLQAHIARYGRLDLVAVCSNALEAFDVLHREDVDLMFLDIRMPSISGIDFIRSLKQPPAVIFTTAYSEYAVAGFEMDAVDYLMKPITYERFEKSMLKFFKTQPAAVQDIKPYTYFKVSGKLVKVMHADILYAQSLKDYILLKTLSGSLLTYMTMKNLVELLPSSAFLRIHRSYLINPDHVSAMDSSVVKIGDKELPVSRNYRDGLKDRF